MNVWDRIAAKMEPEQSGCIRWTGALSTGYGVIQVGTHAKPRHAKVTRLLWVRDNGPIPDGHDMAHSCHNRWCVNVEHVAPATRLENMRQSREAGWPHGKPRVGTVAS